MLCAPPQGSVRAFGGVLCFFEFMIYFLFFLNEKS